MIALFFAAEDTAAKGLPLGLSLSAFIVQLITFVLVFFILKKFAFKPIVKLLEKRRQTIEDGVLLGEKMEKLQANLKEEGEVIIREARHEADKIVAIAHKESREVIQDAEKNAKVKVEAIMKDADARIGEDAEHARRSLEKDIVGLVAEATETVVHEKVDARKDADLIDKALKDRKK
ncbi:F0F1 ATP synthase subunit B [soil metagenome]